MIGNDIVDLSFAKTESNWKRPGFLDKLFTQKEQNFILRSGQPYKMVWLLWSMKESAYKLHVQLFGKRFFAPKKFICTVLGIYEKEFLGKVELADFQCFTQSSVSKKLIHTIAKSDQKANHLSQIFPIENSNYKAQHLQVYKKVKAQFAAILATASHEIRIEKSEAGVPFIYNKKQKEKVAVSISHHGNFGAFAFNKF